MTDERIKWFYVYVCVPEYFDVICVRAAKSITSMKIRTSDVYRIG